MDFHIRQPSPLLFSFLLALSLFFLHFFSLPALIEANSFFRPRNIPRFPSPFQRRYHPQKHQKYSSPFPWKTAYFTQNVDHFSFTEQSYATFQQKYIFWDERWAGAADYAPIFLYCGNEGPIEWFLDNAGWIREIAKDFGAMVLGIEHRYYGESFPFGSSSDSFRNTSTRAYLTTEQALADFAILLDDLKANLTAQYSPVVLFGGSYGGMLAAWFRLKYPHTSIGAIASSAPILDFMDMAPYDNFYRIVSQDFKRESLACFETVLASWAVINSMGSSSEGLQNLTEIFHFCDPLESAQDLKDWLSEAYSDLAMVNYPIATNFLMPLPAFPILEVCKKIDPSLASSSPSFSSPNEPRKLIQASEEYFTRDVLDPAQELNALKNTMHGGGASNESGVEILKRIFAGVSVYYNFSGNAGKCFPLHSDPHGEDAWQYQACTEMVMPMSSNPLNSMFEPFKFNFTEFRNGCKEAFGVYPRQNWVANQFGGKNISLVLKRFGSNIVFSNGALDPWSGGGVLDSISKSLVSYTIPDGAHHLDLRGSTPDDPITVIKQRKKERKAIAKWLRHYYYDLFPSSRSSVASGLPAKLEQNDEDDE